MDAVEFLKECKRMCNNIDCNKCPFPYTTLSSEDKYMCSVFKNEHFDELVEAVEQWAKEHPRKTNFDKLKEVFGDRFKSERYKGCYSLECPLDYKAAKRYDAEECVTCKNKGFWEKEYQEV